MTKRTLRLVMVDLPAVNTPQFAWALNKTRLATRRSLSRRSSSRKLPARVIVDAALKPPRREVWVGLPTWKAIVANKLAPGLLDRYLAKTGYSGQLTEEIPPADAPANLFASPEGESAARMAVFDDRAHAISYQAEASRHRGAIALGVIGVCAGLAALLGRFR